MDATQINLYQAKTQLSSLVERAAKGEEIIIAKSGKPIALLSALRVVDQVNEAKLPEPLPFGKNLLGITFLADNWEDDLPLEVFEDPQGDTTLFSEPMNASK